MPQKTSDYERWQRRDLLELCNQIPVTGPVYELLLREDYSGAFQQAVQQAESGDIGALALIDAYRGICQAAIENPGLGDPNARQQDLIENESPAMAERIGRYLEREQANHERLNRNCPEILSLTDTISLRTPEILQQQRENPDLSAVERRLLGQLYIERDPDSALEQWRRAARAGDEQAAYWYSQGAMENAWKNPKDPERLSDSGNALRYAMNLGNADAALEFGRCSLDGCPGIPIDPQQALFSLRTAALAGQVMALSELVELLRQGHSGIPADPAEAYGWLLYAERLNEGDYYGSAHFEMRRQLNDMKRSLEPMMDPEARERANQYQREFLKRRPVAAKPNSACRELMPPADPLSPAATSD